MNEYIIYFVTGIGLSFFLAWVFIKIIEPVLFKKKGSIISSDVKVITVDLTPKVKKINKKKIYTKGNYIVVEDVYNRFTSCFKKEYLKMFIEEDRSKDSGYIHTCWFTIVAKFLNNRIELAYLHEFDTDRYDSKMIAQHPNYIEFKELFFNLQQKFDKICKSKSKKDIIIQERDY